MPLALAQQHGMGYTGPGTWPHPARDWRSGRVVFPHTTPDGRLVLKSCSNGAMESLEAA
jgi:hypothetical protein